MFAQAVVLGLLPSFARFALALKVPAAFENTAIVRQVELGGTLSSATTTYTVRALSDGAQEYVLTLSKEEGDKTSWFVPKLKGSDEETPAARGFDAAEYVAVMLLVSHASERAHCTTVKCTTTSSPSRPH